MEQFKQIVFGYATYLIGDMGTIIGPAGKSLKPWVNHKGYCLVDIYPIRKNKRVHRLVAAAHLLNPMNKPQVNHKNGNKLDNRAVNLEWVTDKENKTHGYKTGLYNKKAA